MDLGWSAGSSSLQHGKAELIGHILSSGPPFSNSDISLQFPVPHFCPLWSSWSSVSVTVLSTVHFRKSTISPNGSGHLLIFGYFSIAQLLLLKAETAFWLVRLTKLKHKWVVWFTGSSVFSFFHIFKVFAVSCAMLKVCFTPDTWHQPLVDINKLKQWTLQVRTGTLHNMSMRPCNNGDYVLVEHKGASMLTYREELTSLRDEMCFSEMKGFL